MQNNRGTFDRSPIACHFLGLGNFFTATNSPQGAQWFLLLCFSSLSCSLLFFSMFFGVAWHSHTLFVGQLFLWKKVTFHFQIFENKIFNNEKTLMVKKVVWIEIDLLMLWFSCSIDCTYILYFRWTIPSFFFFYFFIHWTKGCKQSLPSIGRKSKEALFLKAFKSFFFSKFDWLNWIYIFQSKLFKHFCSLFSLFSAFSDGSSADIRLVKTIDEWK
jgi:hypothetical protein